MGDPRETVVRVDLANRGYDVVIGAGLLREAGARMIPVLRRRRVAIVTDATVAKLHLTSLIESLETAGIAHRTSVLPAGEATKSFGHLAKLASEILSGGLERSDMILALGGGVIGDLAGFAAGILLRGVDFVQIPTTLLAQVDSSVGGKTGINTPEGKNLVGVFHQPRLVLADTQVLGTLPRRELLAGYAEVVKYGLIDDPAFFAWLEANGPALLDGDEAAMARAIAVSVVAKARVVAADEREAGMRALLNLGHTFGHALEAEMGYTDQLLHGEAVAIGMVMAHEFSAAEGLCPAHEVSRVRHHLEAVGLPVDLGGLPRTALDINRLMTHVAHDKKVADGRLTFILTRGIGRAFVAKDVSPEAVRRYFASKLT